MSRLLYFGGSDPLGLWLRDLAAPFSVRLHLGTGDHDDLLSDWPDHRLPLVALRPYPYLADTNSPPTSARDGATATRTQDNHDPECPDGRWLRPALYHGSGSDLRACAFLGPKGGWYDRPLHRHYESHALAAQSGWTDPPPNNSTTAASPCDYPNLVNLLLTENDAPALSSEYRAYRRSYQSTYKTRWCLSRWT